MVDWRLYERFIARLISEEHSTAETTVTPNAKIQGAISGVSRQVDVLVDCRFGEDISRRILVDAKRYESKVDVKDVETFEGMMKDCRAQRGILVCPKGYTPAALRRAQDAITIKLVPLSELENLDLDSWDPCLGQCQSSRRRKSEPGAVLWDSPYGFAVGDSPLSIFVSGKCDGCRNFHVWCWACGQRFALMDEETTVCGCDWMWLTVIEEEEDDEAGSETLEAVYLLVVARAEVSASDGSGELSLMAPQYLDRKPLR